jgi:hypothetical protein
MKTCACCGTQTQAATCPNCGEASWATPVDTSTKDPKKGKQK